MVIFHNILVANNREDFRGCEPFFCPFLLASIFSYTVAFSRLLNILRLLSLEHSVLQLHLCRLKSLLRTRKECESIPDLWEIKHHIAFMHYSFYLITFPCLLTIVKVPKSHILRVIVWWIVRGVVWKCLVTQRKYFIVLMKKSHAGVYVYRETRKRNQEVTCFSSCLTAASIGSLADLAKLSRGNP